jgi:hypothetical protein
MREVRLPLGSAAMEWEHELKVEGARTDQRRWAWLGSVGIEGEARWFAGCHGWVCGATPSGKSELGSSGGSGLNRGVAALLGVQINWTQRQWNNSNGFWQSTLEENGDGFYAHFTPYPHSSKPSPSQSVS